MAMEMEDVFRITKEVALGRKPTTPDSAEMAEFRARTEREKEEMAKNGQVMDVPSDW